MAKSSADELRKDFDRLKKDAALSNLINDISQNKISHEDSMDKFEDIFSPWYRHDITSVYRTLTNMKEGSLDYLKYSLDKIYILSANILGDNFVDFYATISIEIHRLNATKQIEIKSEMLMQEVDEIKSYLDKQTKDMKNIDSELKSKKEQLSSINNNHISILGIFSGIVMVFFGGLSFATNAFQFTSISILRLTFIICLVGFIMFNSIFLLIYLIGKLTSTEISTKCNVCTDKLASTCESCDKNGFASITSCNPINKIKNLYPALFYIDLCLLTFIAVDFTIWLYIRRYFDLMIVGGIIAFIVIISGIIKNIFSYKKKSRA